MVLHQKSFRKAQVSKIQPREYCTKFPTIFDCVSSEVKENMGFTCPFFLHQKEFEREILVCMYVCVCGYVSNGGFWMHQFLESPKERKKPILIAQIHCCRVQYEPSGITLPSYESFWFYFVMNGEFTRLRERCPPPYTLLQ